jgi:uncharacterized membrane protein (DUF4010 family)
MEAYEPYLSYALALFSGLLIGLEREHSRAQQGKQGRFIGGIRTFPIFALVGAVAASLEPALGVWPFVIAAGGTLALALIGLKSEEPETTERTSFTTEGAFLLSFMLGALSGTRHVVGNTSQKIFVVASLSVIATLLLSAKPFLHAFSSRISRDDVIATVKFLMVAVVVLPLLPDEPHGPYGVLNPYRLGVMVTLISGVSFVGYAASRWLGPGRGLLLTGLVGGLASSTAVTLSASQRARATPELAEASALSICAASVVMSIRVMVLAAAINTDLLARLAWPFVAMALAGAAFSALLYLRTRKARTRGEGPELTNPFELSSALKFTAVIVAVMLVSRWTQAEFGSVALYLAALLAGLADVDAITVSMASMIGKGEVTATIATGAVFAAVAANTVTKGVMAWVIGGRRLAWRVATGFGAMVVAGGVALTLRAFVAKG